MIEQILTVVISILCGGLVTYVIIKSMVKPEEIVEDIMNFIVQDAEMQKKVFVLGAILGNGIKSGVGLNPRGGKFKFEDLIAGALAQFFMPKTESEAQTSEPLKNIFERLKRA